MSIPAIPNTFTIDQLSALGSFSLNQIARNAAGSITSCRLILGRCLVAMVRTEAYLQFGCSSAIHYACSVLGLADWKAREFMRCATCLEDLPRLRVAAENGEIDWAKLREVMRVADPDDEYLWLEICQHHTYREIEHLVRRARAGLSPDADLQVAQRTELRLNLSPLAMQVVERAVQAICHEAGRALPPAEALELICADYLSRLAVPVQRKLEEAREEAGKDLAAQADALECSARNMWTLATACLENACPGNPDIQLVRPAAAHWENTRLHFNPDSRLPTPAQKAELLRRDGYRCKTPGCPHHLFLQAHHVTFYSDQGKSVPENLVILCSACHKNVHEGRLRVIGQAPHNLRFLDATGRDLAVQHTLYLAHWLDFFIGWQGEEKDSHLDRMTEGLCQVNP